MAQQKPIVGLDHLSPNTDHNPRENQPSKRTLQNRKAQREFRERKASYVKSLEQRIRAYEANEVQGNVELQRAARRLKDENDQLRDQVRQLSERLSILEGGGTNVMPAIQPARTPGRSRATAASAHAQQQPQSSQALYNQPQGFSNDATTFDMMSSTPPFPATANPQSYPQYFAQQVQFTHRSTLILNNSKQHYNSYAQHQPLYGQDQQGDVTINPELRRTPGRGDNAPGRPPSAQ